MRYLLDTNACVDYLTGRYPALVSRLQRCSPDDLFLSSVVVAELRYGADRSARRRANHARIDAMVAELKTLDFDLAAAARYGRVRARLEAEGTPIGPNDMLIAAQALSRRLTVVTDNGPAFKSAEFVGFFARHPELRHVRTRHHAPETNGVVERFNRSLKYEHLYREEIRDVIALRDEVEAYRELYNWVRPHETLGQLPPMARYLGEQPDEPEPSHLSEPESVQES